MNLNILVYKPGEGLQAYDSFSDLKHCTPDVISWVDIESDEPEHVHVIAAHFSLHELTIEDCFTPGHFPKLEDFGSYLFMIFRCLKSPAEVEEIWSRSIAGEETLPDELVDDDNDYRFTRKVTVYMGEKFVITFRRKEVSWLDAVVRQVQQYPERTITEGTDVITHRVLDVLIDRFGRGLGFFEKLIDDSEDVAIEAAEEFDIHDLLILKRDLASMRQLMREQRVVISRLATEAALIEEHAQRRYFRDIDDHALSIVKTLDKMIESILGLRDTYFAMANVRLGDPMRILAIITTIAAPLNIVVGLYGMNFHYLPMGGHPFGFWYVVFSMILLALFMLILFRQQKWF